MISPGWRRRAGKEFLAFEAMAVKESARIPSGQSPNPNPANLMSTQEIAPRAALACRDARSPAASCGRRFSRSAAPARKKFGIDESALPQLSFNY
jgi:hypothetical protein